MPSANAAAAVIGIALANAIVSAPYVQGSAIYKGIRYFLSCFIINLLNGCSRHLHILAAFLLRQTFFIDKANSLVFVYAQDNGLFVPARIGRYEAFVLRQSADSSEFSRSRQFILLFLGRGNYPPSPA